MSQNSEYSKQNVKGQVAYTEGACDDKLINETTNENQDTTSIGLPAPSCSGFGDDSTGLDRSQDPVECKIYSYLMPIFREFITDGVYCETKDGKLVARLSRDSSNQFWQVVKHEIQTEKCLPASEQEIQNYCLGDFRHHCCVQSTKLNYDNASYLQKALRQNEDN